MSDAQVYGITGSFAVDGYVTEWHVPVPAGGFRVKTDEWALTDGKPVRKILALADG